MENYKTRIMASIDVGTNTVRLLVAEVSSRQSGWKVLAQKMEIARLGEGYRAKTKLLDEAIERNVNIISDYVDTARELKAETINIVATSAAREATNGEYFAERVFTQTGIRLKIASGEEEARLSLNGVCLAVKNASKFLVIDVGGGSTEFILSLNGNIAKAVSIPIGAVVMTERFINTDPPSNSQIETMSQFIKQELRPIAKDFASNVPLIGTAGTITTLGAIYLKMDEYDQSRINSLKLRKENIEEMLLLLMKEKLSQRKETVGLEPKRADVIIAGTVILLGIMEVFGYDELSVSDYGLLEGILVDLLKQ